MADWRLLRLHRLEAAFHTLRHKELDRTRREDLQFDDDARLAFIDWMDAGPKSVLANFHRYEIRLERSAKNARQELDRRRVALVSTAPVERPKAPPNAKIISIETVERPAGPEISDPEPPPSAPPVVDPAPQPTNNDDNMTKSRQPLLTSPVVCLNQHPAPTGANYEVLSISLSLLYAVSPTLEMGTSNGTHHGAASSRLRNRSAGTSWFLTRLPAHQAGA